MPVLVAAGAGVGAGVGAGAACTTGGLPPLLVSDPLLIFA